jgi:peptidoglycan/xylan/chitin deacetylase (PgdA/CDA1 family)
LIFEQEYGIVIQKENSCLQMLAMQYVHIGRCYEVMKRILRKNTTKRIRSAMLAVSLAATLILGVATQASAAAPSPASTGTKVSFTFDDGMTSALLAAQTLQPFNYTATDYIITGCVGLAAPNNCAANPDANYMTWQQISDLHTTYGWEIASHTVNHPLTAAADNPSLTDAQLDAEMSASKQALKDHGFDATDFASPYGDYDNRSLAATAKYYASHRTFQDDEQPPAAELSNTFPYYSPRNSYPYNNYLLTAKQVQGNVPVATVKAYIDQAVANHQWLVLVFHNIKASGASTVQGDYEYNAADLAAIAQYVHDQNIPVTDVAHGLATGTNIMPNSGFNNGIADGWTSDNAATIVADRQTTSLAGHGSYDGTTTGPLNSISLTGSAADTHLFSPHVLVSSSNTYVLKNFVNVTSTSGEVDFYIDEFDAAGADLKTGRYIAGVTGTTTANAVQVGDVNFTYTPSSAGVASARLQVIVHGSGTRAYVDNLEWLSPTATTTPAPKPGDVNNDGFVNIQDATIVSLNWGKQGATAQQGDVNNDQTVNIQDATLIALNWNK